MPLELIKSKKVRILILLYYTINSFKHKINSKCFGRCEYHLKQKFLGKSHNENDEVVHLSKRKHNHLPDVAKLKRIVEAVITLAKSSDNNTHVVVRYCFISSLYYYCFKIDCYYCLYYKWYKNYFLQR